MYFQRHGRRRRDLRQDPGPGSVVEAGELSVVRELRRSTVRVSGISKAYPSCELGDDDETSRTSPSVRSCFFALELIAFAYHLLV